MDSSEAPPIPPEAPKAKETSAEDLRLTLGELSGTYEELSLLYRLSEEFSGSSVEEICESILDEVTGLVETSAAAIVFAKGDDLYTKSSRGGWENGRIIPKETASAISSALRGSAVCHRAAADYVPGSGTLIVCPLAGKKKTVGAMLVAGPVGKEFYSGELKLLHAIASQAALFIENALLYEELEDFFLSTTASYVKAIESTSKWTAGHTERVTEYALGIGGAMGLDKEALERLKTSGLLHDIGKITVRSEVLDKPDALLTEEWDEIKKHPRVGAEILERIKAFADIAEAVRYHHEHWDGSGAYGLKGADIPLLARILAVADTFDAMTSDRPYRAGVPEDAAVREIVKNSGTQFDPEAVRAFERWRTASGIRR